MIKKNFITIVFMAVLCCFSAAYGADTFVVRKIKVEQSGENATIARQKAMEVGERLAFERMLKRVLHKYREDMATEIKPEEISSLVIGVNVHGEKTTATYYSGTLDITFNMQIVRQFLQERALPYIRKNQDAILIVPLLRQGDEVTLWSKENTWLKLWEEHINDSPLLNMVVPADNAANRSVIMSEDLTVQDFAQGWTEGLDKLAKRYNATRIIIAEKMDEENGQVRVEWQETTIHKNTTKFRSFAQGEEVSFIQKFIAENEQSWRQTQLFSPHTQQKFVVNVPIRDFQHWRGLYGTLTQKTKYKVEVEELAIDQAKIALYFQTSYEELLRSLSEVGLYLREAENGWVLVE